VWKAVLVDTQDNIVNALYNIVHESVNSLSRKEEEVRHEKDLMPEIKRMLFIMFFGAMSKNHCF